MPKLVWIFVAGALVGERWGWAGIAAMLVAEAVGAYLGGMLEAWRDDRHRGRP